MQHIEKNVPEILKGDGIQHIDVLETETPILTKLSDVISLYPKNKSWAKRIVNTHNSAFFNSATLICQNKGGGCRRHNHPDCDEFWVVIKGTFEWIVGKNRDIYTASPGDIVYCKKGIFHQITVISDGPGIRLSISVEEMMNIYES